MEQEEFEAYVQGRYQDQVAWYDRTAQQNRARYATFQWALIVLAATLPVLIPIASQWVTIPVSVAVAIGTAGLKTFKFQENWLNYRTIAESLKKEQHYYNADVGDYQDADNKEALFVERVENLISRENTLWLMTHTLPEEKDQKRKARG